VDDRRAGRVALGPDPDVVVVPLAGNVQPVSLGVVLGLHLGHRLGRPREEPAAGEHPRMMRPSGEANDRERVLVHPAGVPRVRGAPLVRPEFDILAGRHIDNLRGYSLTGWGFG
jgi:hypothetical protein